MTVDVLRPESTWETARLLARPAVTADAQAIFEHHACDPEVARYMSWRPHTEISETLDFLRRCEQVWAEGSAFPWSLWMKGSGEFVDSSRSAFIERPWTSGTRYRGGGGARVS